MLAFPLLYTSSIALLFWYARHHRGWSGGVAIGDIASMLQPAVVIFLLGLALLFRRLRAFSALELLAFSLGIPIISLAGIVAGFVILYNRGNSHFADMVFFFVLPFALPALGVCIAYQGVLAIHRHRTKTVLPVV